MLSKEDVNFIRDVREEVRENRTKEISVKGVNVVGNNPINGEAIEEPYEEDVEAVVTEVSVRTAVDRYLISGVEVRTGDIIVDISIEDMPNNISSESVEEVIYDERVYIVVSSDKLGLGGYNRVEILGRREK